MTRDLPVLLLSYLYLFAALGLAEWLRRRQGYPVDFTRKVVYIAAGMTAYILLLFTNRWTALIPPVSFIFINAFSYWKGTFKGMELSERGKLGTIYFPISFSILTWLLWAQRPLLVAALMPMTWGDALAAAAAAGGGASTPTESWAAAARWRAPWPFLSSHGPPLCCRWPFSPAARSPAGPPCR